DFSVVDQTEESLSDAIGTGRRHRLRGRAQDLEKIVDVVFYDEWPQLAVVQATYSNPGTQDVVIEAWGQNVYAIAARAGDAEPAFWSYQSGSCEKRPGLVVSVPPGFPPGDYPWVKP